MDNMYLTTVTHKDTKLYHGVIMLNRPTPSGCDRWMIQTSTDIGFKTKPEALDCIRKCFPSIPYCIDGKLHNDAVKDKNYETVKSA